MSAVITTAAFGDRTEIRRAAAANAAYARALDLGYCKTSAQQFARQARREAGELESASHIAMRIVIPMRARFAGPTGNSAA